MTVEDFILAENGWMPNNERLPVIVYRGVFEAADGEGTARAFEAAFRRHDWPPQWRDGVYHYHHYHSAAHEALDVAVGQASSQ